ncbi:putative Histidine kinase [Rubrivivax sp. A210]|uniref:sensor histidine kinase n=1 Tax=Rubrivivax sp. A210 TaxID=2772301 RepID=UPI0019187D3F|nr:ATP-binding protein [Rubrivivax sp. A210]CAD5372804.1 putative Histidine kinase [Rubrivivax sp. A210]
MASTGRTPPYWASSLKFKVSVYVSALLVAAFGVFTWGQARQQREDLLETAVAHILQLSDAIVHSTNFMMMEDKPDYVHQIITDVAREKNIDRIRIFSKKGKVIDSTFAGEVGVVLDPKAEGCVSCHKGDKTGDKPGDKPPESLSDRDRVRFFQDANGRRLMGMMQVVRNEPSCQSAACHTHRNAPAVLGVVDIVYSIDGVEQRVNQAALRTAALALAFLLLAAACISLIVHRLVYRPLGDLGKAAQRLAGGNLEVPIPVRSVDEFGQLAGSFNTMMGALRESQQGLADAARQLEQKVEERTQQLRAAEAQALQQQKLAATGLLASGIAHELNNPLTGVLTFSCLIRQKMTEGSQDAEDMDLVIRETKRCAGIIRRLLDFARQKSPERAYADLNALVKETARLVERSAHLQGTSITLEPDPALPAVWMDENQIKQVVMNMLVNAQHATEGGGGIRVATRALPAPRAAEPGAEPVEMVEIRIADTGCGIPEQDLGRIFDPFFTSKEVGKGTGLGLSVSHGIVRAHGGLIEVESTVGVGTTFRICLPMAPGAAAAESSAHQDIPA